MCKTQKKREIDERGISHLPKDKAVWFVPQRVNELSNQRFYMNGYNEC
jgi:hypothetical protein